MNFACQNSLFLPSQTYRDETVARCINKQKIAAVKNNFNKIKFILSNLIQYD